MPITFLMTDFLLARPRAGVAAATVCCNLHSIDGRDLFS